jgi:hypothetical protein
MSTLQLRIISNGTHLAVLPYFNFFFGDHYFRISALVSVIYNFKFLLEETEKNDYVCMCENNMTCVLGVLARVLISLGSSDVFVYGMMMR